MQPSTFSLPLASAELAIEVAAVAAWRRSGRARTMAARLCALQAIDLDPLPSLRSSVAPGAWIELIRLAALRAVRAAVVDDDMQALQSELEVALQALAAA